MLDVSTAVKNAFKADSAHKKMNVTFGGKTYDNDTIYYESFKLKESVVDSNAELIGCVATEMNVKVQAEAGVLASSYAGKPISVSVSVDIGDGTYSDDIPLFSGFIDKAEKDAERKWLSLTCYDSLAYCGDTLVYNSYKSAFNNSSITVSHLRNAIFNGMNIIQSDAELPNDMVKIKKRFKNKDMTAMDIIKHICQANGCFGRIDRYGHFDYVFPSASTPTTIGATLGEFNLGEMKLGEEVVSGEIVKYNRGVTTSESYISLLKNGITMRTTEEDAGVVVDWTNYQQYVGDDATWNDDSEDNYLVDEDDEDITDGTYIIEGNMISYKLSKKKKRIMLANIMRKIGNNLVFKKYSIKCNGMPYVEVGDRIIFKTTRGNVEIIVVDRTLEGIQAMTDTFECNVKMEYTKGTLQTDTGYSSEGSYVSNISNSGGSSIGSSASTIGNNVGTQLNSKEVMYVVSWDATTGVLETASTRIEV